MNPEEEILKKMDEVIDSGLYKPEWDSLMENRLSAPAQRSILSSEWCLVSAL